MYRSFAAGRTGGDVLGGAAGRTDATGGVLCRAVVPLLGEGPVAGERRALLGYR